MNEARPYFFDLAYESPERAFAAFADRPYSLLLDSSAGNHSESRYSFIAIEPDEIISVHNGSTEIQNSEYRLSIHGNPFQIIEDRLKSYGVEAIENPPVPFYGGAAGYFGYDLIRYFERLPALVQKRYDIPQLSLGIYTQVLAFDLRKKKALLCITDHSEKLAEARAERFKSILKNPRTYGPHINRVKWTRRQDKQDYIEKIEKIINYIRAGDIFQANLSQRFIGELPSDFHPWCHYLKLRQMNPTPFSAYLNMKDFVISSSSPERFIKYENGLAETRPIKGTSSDKTSSDFLKKSEKNRAENIMIVDLMRNDFSKVCEPHSIEVPELCSIQSFKNIHHMVSTITGRLKADKTSLNLLQACFPGGSVTGARKIRAMEIIEECEPEQRGVYCGSIGYVSFNGTCDTNIAIRTLIFKDREVVLNVGGGIVAGSQPMMEYQETLLKAQPIFASFDQAQEHIDTIQDFEPLEKSA
jgi:para-aminobenzoate synthetase component 1